MKRIVVIPKNYYSGYFKFLGMVYVRNCIEGLIFSFVLWNLLQWTIGQFLPYYVAAVTFAIICLVVFIVSAVGIRGLPLSKFIYIYIKFRLGKRHLSFRRIMKRKNLSAENKMLLENKKLERRTKKRGRKKEDEETNDITKDSDSMGEEKLPEKLEELENFQTFLRNFLGVENIDLKPKNERYTQEFIEIKNIFNGVVETTNGYYVKIIEFEPLNFIMKSDSEKEQIINTFAGYMKIAPTNIQLKQMTMHSNYNTYISYVEAKLAELKDKMTFTQTFIDLKNSYIDMLKKQDSVTSLARHYYLIFKYESKNFGIVSNEEILKTLRSDEQIAVEHLAACGNPVVISEINSSVTLMELFYKFYNRRSSNIETFQSRYQRVLLDTMKKKGLNPQKDTPPIIRPHNIISPRGLDLTHSDYIEMDGLYYSFLILKDYPVQSTLGWINQFINMGNGIDVDIFFHREETSEIRSSIDTKIRNKSDSYNSSLKMGNTSVDDIKTAIDSGCYLKQGLNTGESFYYVTMIITLFSVKYENLFHSRKKVVKLLASNDYEVVPLTYRMEAALKSVTPLCQLDPMLQRDFRRNVLSYAAASFYPMTSASLTDNEGICIGLDEINRTKVVWDPFNRDKLSNPNMLICGKPGKGKTFFAELLAMRLMLIGVNIFIIAPHKGHEFRRAAEAVGGSFIDLSPDAESKQCINIMEVRPYGDPLKDLMDDDFSSNDTKSYLTNRITKVIAFLQLIVKNMDDLQKSALDNLLIDIYEEFGITELNTSIYENPECTKLKKMPVLEDLYKRLLVYEDPKVREMATYLKKYVYGSANSFSQQTNVDLTSRYCVIDVSNMQSEMLPLGMFVALDYIWDVVRADIRNKKAIFLDEVWRLLSTDVGLEAAKNVKEIFKTCRAFRCSAVGISQDIQDFQRNEYGESLINSTATQISLGLGTDEAERFGATFGLNFNEVQYIKNAQTGHALIRSDSNRIQCDVKATEMEKLLFSMNEKDVMEFNVYKSKQKKDNASGRS